MAINTALRRISAAWITLPWKSVLPPPDIMVSNEDRYELAHVYSGLINTLPTLNDQIGNLAVRQNTGIYTFNLSVYFSGATSYAIAPALPSGWSFDTATGILTVDSSQTAGTYGPFTVTATSAGGSIDGNTFGAKLSGSGFGIDQWDFLE